MKYQHGKQVKIVSGANAFDFESKLNGILSDLNAKGIKYELQLNPATGYLAYIICDCLDVIAETTKEAFEIGGEKHVCAECPFYLPPTDGRRIYTHCPKEQGLTYRNRDCCEMFYEALARGEVELREVWHGKEKDS